MEEMKYDFSSDEVMTEEEAKELYELQSEFVTSYSEAEDKENLEDWLSDELKKHLPEKSDSEINEISRDVISSLRATEEKNKELGKAVESGRDKNTWLASTLTEHSSQMSAQEGAKYLHGLDEAVNAANESMFDTITTKAGIINMNPNLDGFIAERKHANSFNMNAKAAKSNLHAEVLTPDSGKPYPKNSVDIEIKDSSGKVLRRYQAKYGATAQDTIRMINEGDYRGQQLLVPADQVEEVQKAFPNRKVSATISEGNVQSKPLTKEEAKNLQKDAQSGNFMEADWNEYSAKALATGIAGEVGKSCLMGVAVGAGMDILGKVVQGEKVDAGDVAKTALETGADFGVKTAVAGALKVAAEKEVLRVIPKGTPAGTLANIAFIAVEDAKIVGKIASGKLSAREGIDKMQQKTVACVAGIATSVKGAAVGAAIGTVLGPVGNVIGGFLGGAVGYACGSKFGETVVKGYQKLRDIARPIVKDTVRDIKDPLKRAWRVFVNRLTREYEKA